MKKYTIDVLRNSKSQSGFTLIELLVVIAIIGVIAGLSVTNFLGARERARDVKKKSELSQVKTALRLYYNDYQSYPAANNGFIAGCGTLGTGACDGSEDMCGSAEFASGDTDGCGTIYMKKFPRLDGTAYGFTYAQVNSGDDFLIEVPLDNASDPDIAASLARCASAGCSATDGYYCVCGE